MKSKFFRPWVTLLSLLVYLTTGFSGTHAAAWCFGADGHVELRFAPAGACVTEKVPEYRPELACNGRSISPDHCGPCFDVPAVLRARTQSPPTFSELLPLFTPPALGCDQHPTLRQACDQICSNSNAPPILAASSPLRHLTTVVLLN